ncbi:MAG: type II toxin-antitoxin system RelE/ParE family toxin [Desulfobacteraceae bacterium]
MEFTIEFYQTRSGGRPVQDFLDGLKESDPDDFAAVMAGLAKLRSRHYHRSPLSKPIGDDLFELRHVGKLNSRIIYCFQKGRRIILLHGVRNKARRIAPRDRKVALDRKRDWQMRFAQ